MYKNGGKLTIYSYLNYSYEIYKLKHYLVIYEIFDKVIDKVIMESGGNRK